jgi:cell division protein FtsB
MTTTKIFNHPFVIIALTIVSIAFFLSLDKSGNKTQKSSENISVLEYEVNQISNEVIDLEAKIEETESEQFREKVVRNELLLQKEGEYVLQIAENEISNEENECDEENCANLDLKELQSNFDKWKTLIFRK